MSRFDLSARVIITVVLFALLSASCSPPFDRSVTVEQIYSETIFCNYASEGYSFPKISQCAEERETVEGWQDYCSSNSPLTINRETFSGFLSSEDWEWVAKKFLTMKQETWDNFIAVNALPETVSSNMNFGCPYRLASFDDYLVMAEGRTDQTPAPYFPWPVIILSKVGFDDEHKQATLFLSWLCYDVECGYSSLYFLEYDNGKWNVVGATTLAIY